MNFLAHSLLAFGDDDLLVGQFAGDFVRGADLSAHSAGIANGIRLHRHVDAFTDRHDSLRELRALFPNRLRRFSGIAIDVAADYHLARNWSHHAQDLDVDSLESHGHTVDSALASRRDVLPAGLKRLADVMRDERLLVSWGTREGVENTLYRLSRRSPAFAPLADCAEVLWELDDEVSDFVAILWPALHASTRELHEQLVTPS